MANHKVSVANTLSPETAAQTVKVLMRLKKSVMLHGPPGIGKSDIIYQIGSEEDRDVYDIRLLLMTETDVRGIPFYNAATQKMEWAPPSCFPLNKDSNAIVFLDEITQAPPSVQNAALQLVLNRKIGDFELPEGCAIVAAGNRAQDKTNSKPMPKALANRFIHLNVDVDFKAWQRWALRNKVNPAVLGFLTHKPQYLNMFDPSSPADAFPTPRSWVHFVSDVLNKEPNIDDATLDTIVTGAVGDAVSAEFMALHELVAKLPTPEDICTGKTVFLANGKNEKVAAQYSVATSCLFYLKELNDKVTQKKISIEEWGKSGEHFFKFARKNFQMEITTLVAKIGIHEVGLQFNKIHTPSFYEFMKEYSEVFRAAN